MGTFYIVGTPIGNLEDLTLRAARILSEASLIAAEDTRVTRRLLNHLGLRIPLLSCHRHNWPERLPRLLQALEAGDVALVTDAGMPAVSDPGAELAAQVADAGFPVAVIPGPSAVTTALAVAGLPADSFLFLGFLPRRRKERQTALSAVAALPHTLVIFEAPHRLRATLADLRSTLGDRQIAVCRELTKFYEEVHRSTIEEALAYFDNPRGEFVLVVAGSAAAPDPAAPLESTEAKLAAARELLLANIREGMRSRAAVNAATAATGLPRREVYQLWLELRAGGGRIANSPAWQTPFPSYDRRH